MNYVNGVACFGCSLFCQYILCVRLHLRRSIWIAGFKMNNNNKNKTQTFLLWIYLCTICLNFKMPMRLKTAILEESSNVIVVHDFHRQSKRNSEQFISLYVLVCWRVKRFCFWSKCHELRAFFQQKFQQ